MAEAPEHIDSMQENRRLRAAMERMRSKQHFAQGGVVASVILASFGRQFHSFVPAVATGRFQIVLGLVGFVIIAITSIPFVRSACPKCKQPYHSPASLLRSAENPAPCKSCGFQINKHVSRYS